MTSRSHWFSLFLLLFALAGLPACESDTSRAAAQLKVEDFEFTRLEDGTRLFTGKVYNPTDQPMKQVQISVSLLDANNRQIGKTLLNVNDIKANGRTSFRQPLDSDQEGVDGAKVKSLMTM